MPDNLQDFSIAISSLEKDAGAGGVPATSERFNRLQNLFDKSFKAARIGVWECTLPEEDLTWTDTVYELFDMEPQMPLVREEMVSLYTPQSQRKLGEVRSAAIHDGEGFTLEAEILTARGNLRWIRITAIVERDNGVPVRLFGIKQDITAEKTLLNEVRRLADTDPLTGLASRARFEAVLGELTGASSFSDKALVLIDLDGFKAVNDTFGHQAGDDCLRDAAARISAAVPEAAVVARLGGDEFAVIHDCVLPDQIDRICARLVGELEWIVGKGLVRLGISASVGAALITPETPAKDVFALADKALYAVKAKGKNGYRLQAATEVVPQVA